MPPAARRARLQLHGNDAATPMPHADAALYIAPAAGRNGWHNHVPGAVPPAPTFVPSATITPDGSR